MLFLLPWLARGASAVIRDVPGVYPSIQAAIDAASDGDTVRVAPGVFHENVLVAQKSLALISAGGAFGTIIDPGGSGHAVRILGPGASVQFAGFTVRNSQGPGVVTANGASVSINDNIFVANIGGIEVFGDTTVANNTLLGGIGANPPDAIRSFGSTIEIDGNYIRDFAGVAIDSFSGSNTVRNNVVYRNGVGISLIGAGRIEQNILLGNGNATYSAGSLHLLTGSAQTTVLVNNNTIVGPAGIQTAAIETNGNATNVWFVNNIIASGGTQPAVQCSNSGQPLPHFDSNVVWAGGSPAYTGSCTEQGGQSGNQSIDPAFVNPDQSDFRLSSTAPGIDRGSHAIDSLPAIDLDGRQRVVDGDEIAGAIIDVGAFEYATRSVTRVRFASLSLSVQETAGAVQVMVIREGDISGPLTARIRSVAMPATEGIDYLPVDATVTWDSGEDTKPVTLTLLDDASVEAPEFLHLMFSDEPAGARLDPIARVMRIDISDDDAVDLALTAAPYPRRFELGDAVTFPIVVTNLGNALAHEVTVTLRPYRPLADVTPSQGTCNTAYNRVCVLGTLGPGATAIVAASMKGTQIGEFVSADASVIAAEPETNRDNNALTVFSEPSRFIELATYYPLTANTTWTYALPDQQLTSVRTHDTTTAVKGQQVMAVEYDDGSIDYFSNDAGGVRIHRSVLPPADYLDDGVIRSFSIDYDTPLPLLPPTGWIGDAQAYDGAVTIDLDGMPGVNLRYEALVSLNGIQTITTPAGSFEAVLVNRYIELLEGAVAYDSDQLLWLADGIGPVRIGISGGGSAEYADLVSLLVDPDHDGVSNESDPDDDGDAMPDAFEIASGLNPDDPDDAVLDPDADGLSNLQEAQFGTDPNQADSDGDGTNDGLEVAQDRNPRVNEPAVLPVIFQILE